MFVLMIGSGGGGDLWVFYWDCYEFMDVGGVVLWSYCVGSVFVFVFVLVFW